MFTVGRIANRSSLPRKPVAFAQRFTPITSSSLSSLTRSPPPSRTPRSAVCILGKAPHFPKISRVPILLALGLQHQVEREIAAPAADGMKRRQKRRLRSLLVHRSPPLNHLAHPGFAHQQRSPRGRPPLLG